MELRGICREYEVGATVHRARSRRPHDPPRRIRGDQGPSGSGKSTLLNVLGLLDRPDHGTYALQGEDVSKLDDDALAAKRQEAHGFVFQFFHLIPRLTGSRERGAALVLAGAAQRGAARAATKVLESVGLGPRLHHRPDQLSGGERQRVAICRAIIMQPSFLLADEPTGNLDSKSGTEIMQIIEQLKPRRHRALIVTHDPAIGTARRATSRCATEDRKRPMIDSN
jgi:putative ABC transport system ATP-binding protein